MLIGVLVLHRGPASAEAPIWARRGRPGSGRAIGGHGQWVRQRVRR